MTSPIDFSPNFLKEEPSLSSLLPENSPFLMPSTEDIPALFIEEIIDEGALLFKEEKDEKEEEFNDSFDLFKILKEMAESAPAAGETSQRSGFTAPHKAAHHFPLHHAAAKGDIELMKKLMNEGHNFTCEDDRGAMPIVWATACGQKEAVRLLIKVDVYLKDKDKYYKDKYYEGDNVLHMAVQSKQYEIARLLAEAGAPVLQKNAKMINPLTMLFTQLFLESEQLNKNPTVEKTKEIHEILDTLGTFVKNCDKTPYIILIHPNFKLGEYQVPLFAALTNLTEKLESAEIRTRISQISEDISKNDTFKESYPYAKNLLSTFPTGKKYKIEKFKLAENDSLTILADGNYKQFTTPLAKDSLTAFCQTLTKVEDAAKKAIFEKVREAFSFASALTGKAADKSAAEEAFARFEKGESILLPSNFENHFIDVILSKTQNLFIIANTDYRFAYDKPGVMLHHIEDLKQINSDFIHNVLVNQDRANLEFFITIKNDIVKYLTLEAPDQKFGNCTWESHRYGVKGLIYTELLNQGISHEDAAKTSEEYFQAWDNFHNHYMLEEYLSHQPILPASALGDIYLEIQKKKANNTFNESDDANSKLLAKTLKSKEYVAEFKAWAKEVGSNDKALLKADFTLPEASSEKSSYFNPFKKIYEYFVPDKVSAAESYATPDPLPEVQVVQETFA
jgi:hypothetical protein